MNKTLDIKKAYDNMLHIIFIKKIQIKKYLRENRRKYPGGLEWELKGENELTMFYFLKFFKINEVKKCNKIEKNKTKKQGDTNTHLLEWLYPRT